jgi:hypothetical protein
MRVIADDVPSWLAVTQPQDVALAICSPVPGTLRQLAAACTAMRALRQETCDEMRVRSAS